MLPNAYQQRNCLIDFIRGGGIIVDYEPLSFLIRPSKFLLDGKLHVTQYNKKKSKQKEIKINKKYIQCHMSYVICHILMSYIMCHVSALRRDLVVVTLLLCSSYDEDAVFGCLMQHKRNILGRYR